MELPICGDCFVAFLRPGKVHVNFIIPENTNYRIRIYKEGNGGDNCISECVCPECYSNRSFDFDVPVGENGKYYFCVSPYLIDREICAVDPDEYYELKVFYISVKIPVNLNQHHEYFKSFTHDKCASVVALDCSTFYDDNDPEKYLDDNAGMEVMEDAVEKGYFNGYLNFYDSYLNCNLDFIHKEGVSITNLYNKIVTEIKNGRPVMVHYYYTYEIEDETECKVKTGEHWVLATNYDYNNDKTDIESKVDSIMVCDPSVKDSSPYAMELEPKTIAESKRHNTWKKRITPYSYGYVTSSKKL